MAPCYAEPVNCSAAASLLLAKTSPEETHGRLPDFNHRP
jgi:hypothetical protein